MRWFWIDRFTEFVSGSHATALKCVSLSEDYLHDHWPYYPLMPNPLVAEGMAQCGGLLVSEVYRFHELVVLAKFSKCVFDGEVQATHVVVNGTINGPVDARETLELQPNSRVKGDVHYKSIEIQQGGIGADEIVSTPPLPWGRDCHEGSSPVQALRSGPPFRRAVRRPSW